MENKPYKSGIENEDDKIKKKHNIPKPPKKPLPPLTHKPFEKLKEIIKEK